jgi:hypothetical protein
MPGKPMPRRDRSERPSFAGTSARWRESRCEEWNEQTRLAELLTKHLDPAAPIFWTSLENKPLSMVRVGKEALHGYAQKLNEKVA